MPSLHKRAYRWANALQRLFRSKAMARRRGRPAGHTRAAHASAPHAFFDALSARLWRLPSRRDKNYTASAAARRALFAGIIIVGMTSPYDDSA